MRKKNMRNCNRQDHDQDHNQDLDQGYFMVSSQITNRGKTKGVNNKTFNIWISTCGATRYLNALLTSLEK